MADLIENQNKLLAEQLTNEKNDQLKFEKMAFYQNELQASVKFFNNVLIFIYAFVFIVIHVLFIEQYIRGVKRDEMKDTIWLTIFFLYPYVIYMIERWIYFSITYLGSTLFGKTYVFQFDRLFTSTDFYKNPGKPGNTIQ